MSSLAAFIYSLEMTSSTPLRAWYPVNRQGKNIILRAVHPHPYGWGILRPADKNYKIGATAPKL